MSSKAPVAQLDRASDYGSEGCKFESCRARHLKSLLMGCFFIPVGFTIPPMFQTAFDLETKNFISSMIFPYRRKSVKPFSCHSRAWPEDPLKWSILYLWIFVSWHEDDKKERFEEDKRELFSCFMFKDDNFLFCHFQMLTNYFSSLSFLWFNKVFQYPSIILGQSKAKTRVSTSFESIIYGSSDQVGGWHSFLSVILELDPRIHNVEIIKI